MSEPPQGSVTQLLDAIRVGDESARADLLELVYARIRQIADEVAGKNGYPTTLTPTAICHEASAHLLTSDSLVNLRDREQLYATFATTVKHVIFDYARKKKALRRGGDRARVELDLVLLHFDERGCDLFDLDDAIQQLAEGSSRAALVVELRFFGGLTTAEIADVLGVSTTTVEADWRFARSYLRRVLH